MTTKAKRQFITVLARTQTENEAPLVLAVDTIAKVENIPPTAPVYTEGVRSWIWLKGKDANIVVCFESAENVLAKIEEPLASERSALFRLKLRAGMIAADVSVPWLDVVAITMKRTWNNDLEATVLDQEWVVRTPHGILFLTEAAVHELLPSYEEV